MQHCDQTCQVCARRFWAWLKSREHQMNMTVEGETPFAQAAVNSRTRFVFGCEDCGVQISDADIREYQREANMGPQYFGVPRCCERCAFESRFEGR